MKKEGQEKSGAGQKQRERKDRKRVGQDIRKTIPHTRIYSVHLYQFIIVLWLVR